MHEVGNHLTGPVLQIFLPMLGLLGVCPWWLPGYQDAPCAETQSSCEWGGWRVGDLNTVQGKYCLIKQASAVGWINTPPPASVWFNICTVADQGSVHELPHPVLPIDISKTGRIYILKTERCSWWTFYFCSSRHHIARVYCPCLQNAAPGSPPFMFIYTMLSTPG